MELAAVLDAWQRSAAWHEPAPPASDARLEEAERQLGRALPAELRELYRQFDGGSFLGHGLGLLPSVTDDPEQELAVATAGDTLRSWDWPVPDELVVFADDGMGSSFGVWAPRDEAARPVIVQLGEVFEPACLAVVATSIARFLAAWSAYYLPLAGGPVEALAPLHVPPELLGQEDEEHAVARLLHWASPDLPDPLPDPYERGLTAEQVAGFARA